MRRWRRRSTRARRGAPPVAGLLPGAQVQRGSFQLPAGVAMHLSGHHGLLFQSHYINATQKPLTTAVKWVITTIPQEKVEQQAGMIFYSNYGLNIPANQKSSA